ncbi:hypothetical protein B296_00027087 [Ensete ventricosum]|uniref:Uncharacterized protein n=1 Tax=Ensete ventricosum TaxID=4639 RepID=A0A426XSR0_ENSVE|nr:hypothetical protein B296_00027087 [Ensete ventricosum]
MSSRFHVMCLRISLLAGVFVFLFFRKKKNAGVTSCKMCSTVQQSWSKPMLKGVPPSPRDSHSCTTVGDKLFVFGGTDGKNPLKDMHILDT